LPYGHHVYFAFRETVAKAAFHVLGDIFACHRFAALADQQGIGFLFLQQLWPYVVYVLVKNKDLVCPQFQRSGVGLGRGFDVNGPT
jgi:hypothetical protein